MSKAEEWYNQRLKEANWSTFDLCDPPTDDHTAMCTLIDQLLGPDWYVAVSQSHEQTNTVAIYQIISKYLDQSKSERLIGNVVAVFIGIVIGIILTLAARGC